MGKSAALIVALGLGLGLVGCSPLYGSKPDNMAKPQKKKRPPEAEAKAPEIKYIEDCTASFHEPPVPLPIKTADLNLARSLADQGAAALAVAKKSKDPKQQSDSFVEAVAKYGNALKKDPYNAGLTLELAKAYDAVYRKGCAIALLKRIETLAKNPKFASDANRMIDTVAEDNTLFKGYRSAAQAAVGR